MVAALMDQVEERMRQSENREAQEVKRSWQMPMVAVVQREARLWSHGGIRAAFGRRDRSK